MISPEILRDISPIVFRYAALTAIAVAINCAGSTIALAGILTPPVPLASTMRTLEEQKPALNKLIPAAQRFVDALEGTAILDKETGLVWAKTPDLVPRDWQTAMNYCTQLNLGGRMGWRLPTIVEINTLVDVTNPGLVKLPVDHPFQNVSSSGFYWSSSMYDSNTAASWGIWMGTGDLSGYNNTNGGGYAWPVRSSANIDPSANGSRYVWGENIGWINLAPDFGPGVTVTDTKVTGMAWGENIGWIDLSPTGGGVTNDGIGTLSGYAWSENVGWIDFNPLFGGVSINACGEFNGKAYGENIGWISFRSDSYNPFKAVSSWASPVDKVPPVATFTPPLQVWFNTDVRFTFSATDCGSGVKEIRTQLNRDPEVVTPGATAQVTVSQEGTHSFFYTVEDNMGNFDYNALEVFIDKTPPNITLAVPPDKVTYNINTPVTPVYTINDILSGEASRSVDTMITNLIGDYTFTVSATDYAGNSAAVTHAYSVVYPGNVDPGTSGCKYAWGENIGWIDFKPAWGPGVTVTDTAVTGMAWGENIGWIDLSPTGSGIANDGTGTLSGYAWSENVGWISFNPTGGGVTIGPDGSFSGSAWGENIGWISFGGANACMTAAWPTPDSYNFTSQNNVPLRTAVTSNTITVAGITTASMPLKITGGQYSLNGGALTTAAGTVKNGDSVVVQLTSSPQFLTTTSCQLAIGGASSSFRVTTVSPVLPTLSSTPLAPATMGRAYSFTPATTNVTSFTISGTLPPEIAFDAVTGTLSGTPTVLGVYSDIQINASNPAGTVSQSFTLTVIKPTALVTLGNLTQTYDGAAKSVTVATNPTGVATVTITYNGSATAPSAVGTYTVIATINDVNYQGTASGILVIQSTVISKPGDCDGNGSVSIAEVQSAINMFLGLKSVVVCVDMDGSGGVSIAEVQKTINSFLGL
jgi:hypothetical protein